MLGDIFGVDGIVVLVVVLAVLFGSSHIPRLARSLGSAKHEFKAGMDESEAKTVTVDRSDQHSVL